VLHLHDLQAMGVPREFREPVPDLYLLQILGNRVLVGRPPVLCLLVPAVDRPQAFAFRMMVGDSLVMIRLTFSLIGLQVSLGTMVGDCSLVVHFHLPAALVIQGIRRMFLGHRPLMPRLLLGTPDLAHRCPPLCLRAGPAVVLGGRPLLLQPVDLVQLFGDVLLAFLPSAGPAVVLGGRDDASAGWTSGFGWAFTGDVAPSFAPRKLASSNGSSLPSSCSSGVCC
jgi:hypothetical protein